MATEGDHRHCKVCGKVCDVGSETCSRACREKRETLVSTRRNYTYIMYGLIAVLVIVFVLSFVHL
jgi:predicted nucleic acid-binding Zn ribbon protein